MLSIQPPFTLLQGAASLCKVLWCQRAGSSICETKYMPAAEGTPCGDAMVSNIHIYLFVIILAVSKLKPGVL